MPVRIRPLPTTGWCEGALRGCSRQITRVNARVFAKLHVELLETKLNLQI